MYMYYVGANRASYYPVTYIGGTLCHTIKTDLVSFVYRCTHLYVFNCRCIVEWLNILKNFLKWNIKIPMYLIKSRMQRHYHMIKGKITMYLLGT